VNPGKQEGGGREKIKKIGEFFSRYLAANDGKHHPSLRQIARIRRLESRLCMWACVCVCVCVCVRVCRIGLAKIVFSFEALVRESIIGSLPPPTCDVRTIAMLLHVYCAIYDASPTPLLYVIHHTLLVMAISCKGQVQDRCTETRFHG